MNVKHPDGKRTIVMVKDSAMVSEVEKYKNSDGSEFAFLSIGNVGSNNSVVIDGDEWNAFVALVKETDEVVQSFKKENVK